MSVTPLPTEHPKADVEDPRPGELRARYDYLSSSADSISHGSFLAASTHSFIAG
jgi:hypothetical protein